MITLRVQWISSVSRAWISAALALMSPLVHAADGAFAVDHDNPRGSMPTEAERAANPAGFDLWVSEVRGSAEAAEAARDWPKAVTYYQALSFAQPNTAWAFTKLCDIHEAGLRDGQQAEHYCWAALKREDATLADRYHFLDLAFALQVSELRAGVKVKRAQMLQAVLEELRVEASKDPNATPAAPATGATARLPIAQQREVYACRLAASVESQVALEECLKNARAANVPQRSLWPFEWVLFRARNDATGSAAVERAAKEAGLSGADLARLATGELRVEGAAPSNPAPRAMVAKGGGLDEVLAIGAGALGVAAVIWLAMDRERRSKSGLAGQPK